MHGHTIIKKIDCLEFLQLLTFSLFLFICFSHLL